MLKNIGFQDVNEAISLAMDNIYSKSIVSVDDEENYFVIDDSMHGEVWIPIFNEASLYNKYWHIKDNLELPLDNDGNFSGDYFFRYCGSHYNKFSFNYWLDPIQQCLKMGMVRLETKNELDIPLNVYLLNGYSVHRRIDENDVVECQLTAIPQSVKLYDCEESCFKGNKGMAVEGCIPCGTFSVKDNDEDFEESTHAIISGKVTLAEMHTNRMTGRRYAHLVMESLGVVYDVVIPENEVSMPLESIKYVSGVFVLIGHIKWDGEERNGENYQFEIDGTCTEKEFDERFVPYIKGIRSLQSEFFILEVGENRDDGILFMQIAMYNDVGEPEQYRVEYGTEDKDGKRKLYALDSDNVDCEMAIITLRNIAMGKAVPGDWKDITLEVFGKDYYTD